MKLEVPFIQLPIVFDAERMADEIAALDARWWRGRTTRDDGNSALTLITTHGDPDSDALSGPMQPTPALLQCPYLMQVLGETGATWGRARLMRLSVQAEVARHVDINYYWRDRMRVHFPVVTSPQVRFQCGDGEINMAAGECWIFDTWRRHRVVNEGNAQRIHLVADTVGGETFRTLLDRGRAPGQPSSGWVPRRIAPDTDAKPALDYESLNVPTVMTPWEIRIHADFLVGEAVADARLGAIRGILSDFCRDWRALWACHGEAREGWPHYRRRLEQARSALELAGAGQIGLRNEAGLMEALAAYVFDVALAGSETVSSHARQDVHGAAPLPPEPARPRAVSTIEKEAPADPVFERPVFIVSPPRSGSTLLFETLGRAPGVYTIGDESHRLIEGVPGLSPADRGYDSNRLLAIDAGGLVREALRERFASQLRDRDGNRPASGSRVRMLEKTPKNALRIPFLKDVFPQARFIYLHRDPREVLASMMEGWLSGGFRMYSGLPGWNGTPWSFLLVPGWRSLSGHPLEQVVAAQWRQTIDILHGDLAGLPGDEWIAVDYAQLLRDPQGAIQRLCGWAGWSWDATLQGALPLSRYTLTAPRADKWRRHAGWIEPALEAMGATAERAASLLNRA